VFSKCFVLLKMETLVCFHFKRGGFYVVSKCTGNCLSLYRYFAKCLFGSRKPGPLVTSCVACFDVSTGATESLMLHHGFWKLA